MEWTSTLAEVTKTIAQLKIRITDVLIAVARLELSPDTPILARSAVIPAKKADDTAQKNHCISLFRRLRIPINPKEGADQMAGPFVLFSRSISNQQRSFRRLRRT